MALRSGLGLWAYTPPTTTVNAVIMNDYSAQVTDLYWTDLSPGGHGSLTAMIRLRDARLPRPELTILSHVAVKWGNTGVWIGEVSEPEMGLSATEGEYLKLQALGIGNGLRDDPLVVTYSNQTANQIMADQFSRRSAFLSIDSDQSQVFPDNPATSLSPVYTGRSMEEVVADLCGNLGDYSWGTWAHPVHRDVAGYPTGQLIAHLRDTTTVTYSAQLLQGDAVDWRITPSMDRAYNVISIGYNDPSQATPVGTSTYTDARLSGSGAQGTAPFRRRAYYRNMEGTQTVTKAMAQTIANTYGAQYQNPSNQITITLRRVRDPNGLEIPLWAMRSDKNIFIPELAVRGGQLTSAPVAGANLFYIKQVEYLEQAGGEPEARLTCDNFVDSAEVVLARLQLQSDVLARTGSTTTGAVQALGAPISGGPVGASGVATGASQVFAADVTYPVQVTTQAPTSITLVNVRRTNVTAASIGVSNIGVSGFRLFWTSAAAGQTEEFDNYTTVGNCLLDVDEALGTFAHHCDVCGTTRRGLSLKRDLHALSETDDLGREHRALWLECCGGRTVEGFSTEVTAEDEDATRPGNWHHRARQTRLIRQAMRHEAVGLPVR